jgi:hypothetical protein
MEAKELFRKARINNIVLGIALLVTIGFFFYGLSSDIQRDKERQMAAAAAKVSLERQQACEALSASLKAQLQEKERLLNQARTEAAILKEQQMDIKRRR